LRQRRIVAPRQGQIANPHDRAVFDGQRRAPAPPTTPGACGQVDIKLEPATGLEHAPNNHPLDPRQAANVIQHPLFLLGNATRQRERAADVLIRASTPFLQQDPSIESAPTIFGYIEAFYNRRRRHSRVGMRSPADFETRTLSPDGTGLAASRVALTHRIRLTSPTAAPAA
jgi:hypothetical protein